MIVCNNSKTPSPVFPLTRKTSSGLQPIKSTISSVTSSGFAEGKSILLRTGMISKSFSNAKYRLEMVCACILCAASTINKAPSQAAMERETS